MTGVTESVQPYGWDWSATTHEADDWRTLAKDLVGALGGAVVLPGKGLQGWKRSLQSFDGEGHKIGTVYLGGREDVHVVSTSEEADASRWAVLGLGGARTSRVDTRVDTLVPFEDLRGVCEDVAGQKARVTYYESTLGGESTGRTIYVGSPSSAVRVRVYEKWLESPGQYEEGANRVEVQLRPPSRAKAEVSGWAPAETFCASELTRRLASELGSELAHPGSLQKSRGTPDLERTIAWMGEQYGPAVDRWLRITGGDLGSVMDHLLGARPRDAAGVL